MQMAIFTRELPGPLPDYFTQTLFLLPSLVEVTQVIFVAARYSTNVSMQILFSIVGKE